MYRFLLLVMVFIVSVPDAWCRVSVRFMPEMVPPMKAGAQETLVVTVRSSTAKKAAVSLGVPAGISVSPKSRAVQLDPHRQASAFFKLTPGSKAPASPKIAVLVDGKAVGSLTFGEGYDLAKLVWKGKWDKDGVGISQGWMKPGFDDSSWGPRGIPSGWQDVGVTYLRARVYIPKSWQGKDAFLRLAAVDDNDVCYLNGKEVGRTNGWDQKRVYKLNPAVKWGQENLLCIAVDNTGAGGGIYRATNYLGVGKMEEKTAKPKLAPAGKVGNPLPFRPMHLEDGVLKYPDGTEVALWGVNYYPQSWYQFDNMKRLGVDMKKAIRDDLDDMRKMGVEVIRIHVFDREISDRAGNLLDNEHLELLDYLIAEGSKRGIYFMFTPIAWWPGPNENKDSFSARCPKEFMFCDDETIKAEANYFRNWLNHVNRFNGRAYKDEPAICALEIMNEPGHANYDTMMDPQASYYAFDLEKSQPFKMRLQEKWKAWCKSNGIEPGEQYYSTFGYELMSKYFETMYQAIRHTGAKQPVAAAIWDLRGVDGFTQALADSRIEAITTGLYAGDWNKVGDGWNYLTFVGNRDLDPRLDKKARLVYEWDGIKTFGSYFYPAGARHFRHYGVQICCMFQYDSSTTAEWNTDWDAHYLNWLYTPGKAVSFAIGGKVFHELSRGVDSTSEGTTQQFGSCAVSFDRNMSIYSVRDGYFGSAPFGGWCPLPIQDKPTSVMAVGDSPYAEYAGTGIYTLEMDYSAHKGTLTINPDADIVGDPWHPRADKSAVVLKSRAHPFRLSVADIKLASVQCGGKPVAVKENGFDALPGEYLLEW